MRRTTCKWALSGVLATAVVLGVTGCFKGDFATCKVTCATSADCPGGLACNAQGICSPGGAACSAMPDADLSKPQPLTVTKSGEGDVQSNPAGINCGETCMAEFGSLSSVTLAATPAASSVFEGWTGDCSGTTDTCTLTMDGPKSVEAQFALHGAKRWVKHISFSGQDYVDGKLELDAMGNPIVSGAIEDNGTKGIYTVKYNKNDGSIIWERKIMFNQAGGFLGGLDTDANGNVYVCSSLSASGPVTIGPSTVSGDLFGNILVFRLAAADGAIEWAQSYGGSGVENCGGIAVLGNDFFIAGYSSSDPSVFGAASFSGNVNYGFVAKGSITDGSVAAGDAKAISGNIDIYDVASNGSNQVAIVGDVSATSALPDCNINRGGTTGRDGFLVGLSTSLTCQLSVSFGSNTANENVSTNAVAPMPGGGWAITGVFEGSVFFGTNSVASQGMRDVFVARYTNNGTNVWAFGYGGANHDAGQALDVTQSGEVVFGGMFSNTISLGSTTLTGTSDVFVTRLSAGNTPIHEWAAKLTSGSAYDSPNDLRVDSNGTITVMESFSGMTDVSGTPLSAQDNDAWVGSFVR